jgi:hypothetical protein
MRTERKSCPKVDNEVIAVDDDDDDDGDNTNEINRLKL